MTNKIFIYGGFCCGKTYIAEELSKKLNIPVYHLDDYYWHGDWEHIDESELLLQVKSIAENEQDWIIEGNYSIIRNFIFPYCNKIYFCYSNLSLTIWRAFKRSFDKERLGVPKKVRELKCTNEPIFELLLHVSEYRIFKFSKDKKYIKKWKPCNGTEVIILKSTNSNVNRELLKYYDKNQREENNNEKEININIRRI